MSSKETLQLKVVTPNGSFVDLAVTSFTVNTKKGEICILPKHCLLLSEIVAGKTEIIPVSEKSKTYVLDEGFLEAGPAHINVISKNCIDAKELDFDSLKIEVANLEKELTNQDANSIEGQKTNDALNWARACLSTVQK